ncbi:PTS system nitrogen regulatory IIA component [Paraburkholderia sp. GAS334]
MQHSLAHLRRLLGRDDVPGRRRPRRERANEVIVRITLDAQHAAALRHALIRDCGGQSWTIRLAPLRGTDQMQLALYLPKEAVTDAMRRVAIIAPGAAVDHMLEIPDAPSDAWRDLTRDGVPDHVDSRRRPFGAGRKQHTIADLLRREHVLLDLKADDREALFVETGRVVERHHGLSAEAVTAGLLAREALGSTGLGQGVAVPHGQISGLHQELVLYVRLALPILFDAPDGYPVSDAIVLLVPEWANTVHLNLLADAAQHFCDHEFRERLRVCRDANAVLQLFKGYETQGGAMHR